MLIDFFFILRAARLPVSVTEYLALLEAMKAGVAGYTVDEFYQLSRTIMIKDESLYDRFDVAFGAYFEGVEDLAEKLFGTAEIPEDWIRKQAERLMSEEDKAQIEALGGFEKLMETLQERLKEQQERHQGGNKWIGTAGTSPFGAYGYNPEGIRIGQKESRHQRAVKVWDDREFKNLDDGVELGTRNIKVALRRLRKFARQGNPDQLDLDDTIASTARQGGLLDIKMVPERHNAVKVLLFLDVGGSMDPHVQMCEELFSAARTEFKHLEYFYFHNFIYEKVWQDNSRRHTEIINTLDVLHKYGRDYKVIFVGDATMSPYEILYEGGSVEHWNKESGATWMQRVLEAYPNLVWLNPNEQEYWQYTHSVQLTQELVGAERMFPMTLAGLDNAMKALSTGKK